VDITLEYCRYVSKAKGYDYIFKMAISCTECYFLFFSFLNINLIIYILYIDLTKDFGARKVVKDLRDEG
jgi:hypothetical protein